ncbi:hypothetical protein BGW80DRAFT_1249827 [Lactifluus volemus]|nr:hypothetical protein BGW80DRAFT_1249827 [Lactifluus volemus]
MSRYRDKFGLEKKTLDPSKKRLVAKEVCGRCIEHTIHLMACHFISALNVPGLAWTKTKIHGSAAGGLGDEPDFEDPFDVDTSLDVDASPEDAEAMLAASVTTFDAGDVIRSCNDDTREYLAQIAMSLGCPRLEIKLWVRTRWGSLSDCFQTVITMQKAIDRFCRLADEEDKLPPLSRGRKWADYQLTAPEWDIVKLAQDCLMILKKYLKYYAVYHLSKNTPRPDPGQQPPDTLRKKSATEQWMAQVVRKHGATGRTAFNQTTDCSTGPFAEVDKYLAAAPLSAEDCPDIIAWYGMGSEKFGALQRLQAAYRDGRLNAWQETWMEIGPSFASDIEN